MRERNTTPGVPDILGEFFGFSADLASLCTVSRSEEAAVSISARPSGGEKHCADEESREEAAARCEGDEPPQEPGSEGSTLHRHEFDVDDRPDGQEG